MLNDVIDMAAEVAHARGEGKVLAEDLARQAALILTRLQLVPAQFPLAPTGPLELRLAMDRTDYSAMFLAWESANIARELADMAVGEEHTWRYVRGAGGVCVVCVEVVGGGGGGGGMAGDMHPNPKP